MRAMLLWLPLAGLLMGAGLVRTRDGKVIEGDVLLADGVVIVRSAGGGAETTVALADLRQAVLKAIPIERPANGTAAALPSGWQCQDIGAVHRKGRADCDKKGAFTIHASGWGAWGPEDTMHYAYRPLEGDGQIIARLAKVDDSRGRMAATVMIRQDLAADAPMAGATIHPSGEVRLSRRVLRDAADFLKAEELQPQPWIRLTRRGDLFSAYRSADGKYWKLVDSRTIEISPRALVGLGAWTLANTSLGMVQMDSVLIIPGTPCATWFQDSDGLQQGIIFRDGAARAGTIQGSDENGVKLLRNGQVTQIPWPRIARLVFNSVPPDLAGGKMGLWMSDGDFIEGEVSSVTMRPVRPESRDIRLYVTVKSVLFGIRQVEALRDAMMATLADVTPVSAAFQLRTADGSVYRVNSIEIRESGVLVDGSELAEVVEITREPK